MIMKFFNHIYIYILHDEILTFLQYVRGQMLVKYNNVSVED